jgi:hypothetical protein
MKRIFLFSVAIVLSTMNLAAEKAPVVGAGKIAENLMVPVSILANFIGTMSIIIGITALFASFLKYMQYRVNPLASPIGTVFMLLIMGIVLLCLPLAYKLTTGGVPITL